MSVFGKVASQRVFGVVAALAVAVPAFGAFNPGDTWLRPPNATAYELAPVPAGYTLIVNDTDSNTGQLLGTTISKIYKNNVDGTLLFSYQVDTTPLAGGLPNQPAIKAANMDGPSWTGITISRVGADGTVGGAISGATDSNPEWTDGSPYSISRADPDLADPNAAQSPSWLFQNGSQGTVVGPNNVSAEIWFATNALSYTKAFIGYLGQGSTGRAEVWVPVLVPDPASLALIGLATGGMALFRRRRTA